MSLVAVPSRRLAALLAVLSLVGVLTVASSSEPAEASSGTPVMRDNRVTPQQMAAWFRSRNIQNYAATTSIENLAYHYIAEGRAEGVAGDVAFVQAILETGWFRYATGQVEASSNNYAGMGACDGGTCTVAQFRTPRIGVRAHIQHLRRYADPHVTESRLAYPLESPRWYLVEPPGRAPMWEDFGGIDPRYGTVTWASDDKYSDKILNLYRQLLDFASSNGGTRTSAEYGDVRFGSSHRADIAAIRSAGWTNGCHGGHVFCPDRNVTRGEMASFLVRAGNIRSTSTSRYADVPRSHTHHDTINALASAGFTNGCGNGRYCPDRPVTRAEMASFLQRVGGLPERGSTRFSDVNYSATHGRSISAIADAGWTNGCHGGGTYCPDRPVTRQEMASFLRRAFLG